MKFFKTSSLPDHLFEYPHNIEAYAQKIIRPRLAGFAFCLSEIVAAPGLWRDYYCAALRTPGHTLSEAHLSMRSDGNGPCVLARE
jgi:hypothetical protein